MRALVSSYDRLIDVLSVVCAGIILATMLAVAVDVCSRYFFGVPLAWVFELTEYALLYVPCLGIGWLAREGGHVAIDTFVSMLPEFVRRQLFLLTTAACAAVCGMIAYWGAVVVADRYRRGTIIHQMIATPEYIILWVIPFGFGLAAIEFARLLVRQRSVGAVT
jgi:TRAP-type C4-dicarboxylate transport system permease small subunit